jgi:predicted flap endonuclease-1-like 5' DNA nuclease
VASAAPVSVPKQPKLPSESQRSTDSRRGADSPRSSGSPHRGSSALAEQSAELERARKSLAAKDERISKLVAQAETLRGRAEEADARTAEKEEELARLRSQHDSLRSLTAVRAERIRELENTHGEQQRRIAELELELREQAQVHEAAIVNLKAEQELAVAQVKAEQEQAKAPERDDLRAIYGIGPKFEKGLHAAGIHRYRQIAEWTNEDVDAIAATLGVKPARIRKAGWVESARKLLAERGDEAPPKIEGEESDIAW